MNTVSSPTVVASPVFHTHASYNASTWGLHRIVSTISIKSLPDADLPLKSTPKTWSAAQSHFQYVIAIHTYIYYYLQIIIYHTNSFITNIHCNYKVASYPHSLVQIHFQILMQMIFQIEIYRTNPFARLVYHTNWLPSRDLPHKSASKLWSTEQTHFQAVI